MIVIDANIAFLEKGLELETVHRCCRNEVWRHLGAKWQIKVSIHSIHFPASNFLSVFCLLIF